jgi:hypothetical protein
MQTKIKYLEMFEIFDCDSHDHRPLAQLPNMRDAMNFVRGTSMDLQIESRFVDVDTFYRCVDLQKKGANYDICLLHTVCKCSRYPI